MPRAKSRPAHTLEDLSSPAPKRVKVESDGAGGSVPQSSTAGGSLQSGVLEAVQHNSVAQGRATPASTKEGNVERTTNNSGSNPVTTSSTSATTQKDDVNNIRTGCSCSDIDLSRGASFPTKIQTAHILVCNHCYTKISQETYGQDWLDWLLRNAVMTKRIRILQQLLVSGANPAAFYLAEPEWRSATGQKFANDEKCTALHLAVAKEPPADCDRDIVRALCERPAALNRATSIRCLTALNIACNFSNPPLVDPAKAQYIERHYRIIMALLDVMTDANIPSQSDKLPIHTFIQSSIRCGTTKKFEEVLPRLIRKTADLNIATGNGDTALTMAAKSSSFMISSLLKRGANPRIRDRDGMVALHHTRSLRSAELLFNEWREAVQCKSTVSGLTPLHTAVIWGLTSLVKMIVEHDPQQVHVMTNIRQTCLHLTRFCEDEAAALEIIQYLLQKHCDPHIKDIYGYTALHFCVPELLPTRGYLTPNEVPFVFLSNETKRRRLAALLPDGHRANEPEDDETLLGFVLSGIFDRADEMKRAQRRSTDTNHDQASEDLGCSLSKIESLSAWVNCAKIIISKDGQIQEDERKELLSKKTLRADPFAGPFFRFLEKHEKFNADSMMFQVDWACAADSSLGSGPCP